MNDIFGIIIPLLMSGADIGDIVKALGAETGAAGMDGLKGMRTVQLRNARLTYPLVQNQDTIDRAAEGLLDTLNINPYSSLGQGAASFLGGLYHLAPDVMGTLIGVPSGSQFFSTVANGAAGISEASGMGQVDIFNPYGVMSAHANAQRRARQMYDMGVRRGGGFNVSYSHGLSMGEMGKVAQRVLSSELAYMDEDGRRLDLSTDADGNPINKEDAEKFSGNLRRLGSKFNEAASMLAKMTGSVDEALKVMDRMAGGSFLGGTADQAEAVAMKARNMATAIRVTSAIGGISPQEVYANMAGLMQATATASGMSQYVASASGYSGLMQNMAYTGASAYSAWAAMNPKATQMQRDQALLAANGRTSAYSQTNGAAFSAAIADNRHLFSDDEMRRIEAAYRAGRPNDVVDLVRGRIGESMYNAYMTDPSMQIAARYRLGPNNETLNMLDSTAIDAGMRQAETWGNRRLVEMQMHDVDNVLASATGNADGLYQERDNAVKTKLMEIAVKDYKLSEAEAKNMDRYQLREYLEAQPGMDAARLERVVNSETIAAAERQIDARTMSSREEKSAREKLLEVARSRRGGQSVGDIEARLDKGESLESVFDSVTKGMDYERLMSAKTDVFGGKLSGGQSRALKSRLERVQDSQRADYSADETLAYIENRVKRERIENAGALNSVASRKTFGRLSDSDALERFSREASELESQGLVSSGGASISNVYERTAGEMLSDVLGGSSGKLGNLEGEEFNKLVASMSPKVMENVTKGGMSLNQSFAQELRTRMKDEAFTKQIGEKGVEQVNELLSNLDDSGSELVKDKVNVRALLNRSTAALRESSTTPGIERLSSAAERLGTGQMSDRDRLTSFAEEVGKLGASGQVRVNDDGKLTKTYGEASRRMLSDVLGGSSGKLGNLEGEEFNKLVASMSPKVMENVTKGGMSLNQSFAQELRTRMKDEAFTKQIGEKGVEQVNEFIKQAESSGVQGVSMDNLLSNAVSSINAGDNKFRTATVTQMSDIISGKTAFKSDKEMSDKFVELSKAVGVFKGGESDASKIRDAAFGKYINDALGADVSESDKKAIRESARQKFGAEDGGDYGKAAAAAMREHAASLTDKGSRDRISAAADKVGGSKDAGRQVAGNMLAQMESRGIRRDGGEGGFAAIAQAGTSDMAGIFMASAMTGISMEKLIMNQYAAPMLSEADKSFANATQNRVPNAMRTGGTSGFVRAAIDKTEQQMMELGKALDGKVTAQEVRSAFTGEGDEAKKAKQKVEAAVKSSMPDADEATVKERMNLVRTATEGIKIGGKDALDVMMGGEDAFKKLKESGGTDEGMLNISRSANRKDSDAFKIMDGIGQMLQDFGRFLESPIDALHGQSVPVHIVSEQAGLAQKPFGN